MIIFIRQSKRFRIKDKADWHFINLTLLEPLYTIIDQQKRNKISYIKDFGDFMIEVSTIAFNNNIYILEVNKNALLFKSAI